MNGAAKASTDAIEAVGMFHVFVVSDCKWPMFSLDVSYSYGI